jgi:hypothetical protein
VIQRPEGVALKLARADHHLREIGDMVDAYLASNPYMPESRIATEGNMRVNRTYLKLAHPISNEVAVIVGDFFHNLRSSLDHLARGLVLTEGNRPRDEQPDPTSFPIRRGERRGGLRISGGAHPDALALVERMQPYHAGNRYKEHPLFLINDLNNVDKHRSLHLVTAAVVGAEMSMAFKNSGEGIMSGPMEPGPLYDGAHIGTFGLVTISSETGEVVESSDPGPDVELLAHLNVCVTLGEVGMPPNEAMPVQDRLYELLRYVREDVVPLFDPFFSSAN